MKTKLTLVIAAMVALVAFSFQKTNAQNIAPYWSLAGNSNASATTSKLGTTNAIPLRFFTTNLERMRIIPGGNVGIGTTAPVQMLHVVGRGVFTTAVGIGTTAPAQRLHVIGNGVFSGNLGVGTSAPTNRLHVVGNSLFTNRVVVSAGGLSSNNSTGNGVSGTSGYIGVYGRSTGVNYDSSIGVYGSGFGTGVVGIGIFEGVFGKGRMYGVNGIGELFGVIGNGVSRIVES